MSAMLHIPINGTAPHPPPLPSDKKKIEYTT